MLFFKNIFINRGRAESLLPPLKDIALEYQEENEFSCLLEEYRALRAEIVSRLESQQEILNYTVVLIAAALPFGGTIIDNKQYTFLLLIPLVFDLLAWLFLVQENMIDALGVYLNVRLAPRMEQLLGHKLQTKDPMWEWELFQYSTFYGSFLRRILQAILGAVRYILPILPGGVSIIAYWSLFYFLDFYVSPVDIVLASIDILIMLFLAISAISLKPSKFKVLKERSQRPIR